MLRVWVCVWIYLHPDTCVCWDDNYCSVHPLLTTTRVNIIAGMPAKAAYKKKLYQPIDSISWPENPLTALPGKVIKDEKSAY